jgi:hypothetical protein
VGVEEVEEAAGAGGSSEGRGYGLAVYSWRARKASRRPCLGRE